MGIFQPSFLIFDFTIFKGKKNEKKKKKKGKNSLPFLGSPPKEKFHFIVNRPLATDPSSSSIKKNHTEFTCSHVSFALRVQLDEFTQVTEPDRLVMDHVGIDCT